MSAARIYVEEFAVSLSVLVVCALFYFALVGAFDYRVDGWFCLLWVGWVLGIAQGSASKRIQVEGEKQDILAELLKVKYQLQHERMKDAPL